MCNNNNNNLTNFSVLEFDTWATCAALDTRYHYGNDQTEQEKGSNHAPYDSAYQHTIHRLNICPIATCEY